MFPISTILSFINQLLLLLVLAAIVILFPWWDHLTLSILRNVQLKKLL